MDQAALRQELAELTAAVRAFVEWHAMTGSAGLPGGDASPGEAEPAQPQAAQAWRPAAAHPDPTPPPAHHAAQAQPAAHPPPHHDAPQASHARPAAPPPAHPPAAHAPAHAPANHDAEAPWLRRGPQPAPPAAPQPPPASAGLHAPVAPAPAAPPPGATSPEERRVRLATLAEEVRGCTRCGLHAGRTQTVFHRGDPGSEIVFVGEGPGMEEDLSGEPFVGQAGQLLDKMIAAMGYRRDDVYICNIVKCRPPGNRKPEPDEIAACSPYLASQLALVRPKVMVALGATAVQGLLGTSEGITRLRGTWKLYKGSTPVMPTFHPAYLLRQPGAKREVWSDLKEVMRFLGKPVRERG